MARSVRRSIIALVLAAAGLGQAGCTNPSGGASSVAPAASAPPTEAPSGSGKTGY